MVRPLVYAGKVQTGYSVPVAQDVREALDPYIQRRSPLTTPVDKPKATWVQPMIDAEVAYSSLTDRGLVREAVFKGLRDDLAATPGKALSVAPARRVARHHGDGVPKENILQLLPDAVVPTEAGTCGGNARKRAERPWRREAYGCPPPPAEP
jgi:bifunctional non-homologous end joining protein LigD